MEKSKLHIVFFVLAFVLIAFVIWGIITVYNNTQHRMLLSQHPMEYSDLVEKYAEENDLDPYLVYAVIKTESSFIPTSVSNAGATGLMQIMSETFDWIQFRLDDTDAQYADMENPEKNIQYGCYLLGYLYRLYGNWDCAIAAYHAGPGNVSSWLENSEYSTDGKTLIHIPIKDTQHYLNKITRAFNTYKELYENEGN